MVAGLVGVTREEPPKREVVIWCQTWGHEGGSEAMVDAMREAIELVANWVQIHPYWRLERDGEISFGCGIEIGEPAAS